MSEWRYWITYEGKVSGASTEAEARAAALAEVIDGIQHEKIMYPLVEVEEVGEGE